MKDYYTLDDILTLRHKWVTDALKEGYKIESVLTDRYATGMIKGDEYIIVTLDDLQREDTTLNEQDWNRLPCEKVTLKILKGALNQEEIEALRKQKKQVGFPLVASPLLRYLLRKNRDYAQLPLIAINEGIYLHLATYLREILQK